MALTQISTKGIKDGTITNADINSSAAIAGSKISPDFGSQNITTTGGITGASGTISGNLSMGGVISLPDTIQHVNDTDTKIRFPGTNQISLETGGIQAFKVDSSGDFTLGRDYSTNPSNSLTQNYILRGHSVNNTAAEAEYARLFFKQSTVAGGSSASIRAYRDGGNHRTGLKFFTHQNINTSGDGIERLKIAHDGTVDIGGNLDVGAGLDVTGNITATGTVPATNIDISGVTTSSALQVVFSTGNSGTAKTLAVDSTSSKFTYDPGSNLLQVDNIKLPDSSGSDGKINLGTGVGTVGDFQLYFDGSAGVIKNTTGNLFVQSIGDVKLRTNDSELAVNCIVDSAVELYHNSTSGSASKKLETYSDGVIVTGNLHVNSGNNYVRSEATDGCIEIRRGAGEPFIDFKVNDVDFDARMKMNSNQNNEFEFSTGIIVPTNKKLNCGTNLELELFHENTNNNSVINNKTGDFFIENDSGSTTERIYVRPKAGQNSLTLVPNGSVELHFNGDYRLTTQNAGVDMRRSGTVTVNLADVADGQSNNHLVSMITGLGKDNANNFNAYSTIVTQIIDNTNGSEDGRLYFQSMRDGSLVTAATVERGFFQRNTAPGFAGESFQWVNTNPNMHNGSIKWTSGHFVNSTGIFTCPVAGKYLCMATVQSHRTNDNTDASTQYFNVLFQKNNLNYFGESVGTQHSNGLPSTGTPANHFQVTQAVIIDAAVNETIRAHSNHGYRYAAQNQLSIILIA